LTQAISSSSVNHATFDGKLCEPTEAAVEPPELCVPTGAVDPPELEVPDVDPEVAPEVAPELAPDPETPPGAVAPETADVTDAVVESSVSFPARQPVASVMMVTSAIERLPRIPFPFAGA
jgi:hypothetical protein